MGASQCCTKRDEVEKDDIIKLKFKSDLTNKKDLEEITDPQERFKFLFPFYRMDISVFQAKLKEIQGLPIKSFDTTLVSIEQLKSSFCMTKAWIDDWDRVEKLIMLPELK